MMRDAALRCLNEIGVDTGGSNVQFAINPQNGRMIVARKGRGCPSPFRINTPQPFGRCA
jgi:hypothetical protein